MNSSTDASPSSETSNLIEALEAEQLKRRAQRNLADFIRYTFPNYEWSWHHEEICNAVMAWIRGDVQNLAIQCPPAHGKSEIISRRLPAFLLALYPGARVIAASYAATLAESMSRDVRTIMHEPAYGDIYGAAPFARDLKDTVDEFHTVNGGRYVCSGVGGGLIGKHFDFGIIDDPVKDAEEAFSETMRENLWQWYTRVWSNRKRTDKAKELVIMHRWHEDDLLARILQAQAGRWRVINLEAIASQDEPKRHKGDALWPDRFDLDFLEAQRKNNPYGFESLYMGRPIAEGGGMFKRVWFRDAEKNGSPTLFKLGDTWRNVMDGYRYCTVDLAASVKTTGDYTVISTLASMPSGDLVLLNVRRERLEGPDIIPAIKQEINAWGCGAAHIERIGFQTALIQDARRQGVPVFELNADKDKVTRAAPLAALYAAGKVFHAPGDWRGEYEKELLSFPAAAHDDQVDAVAYGARVHNQRLGETFKRHALKI